MENKGGCITCRKCEQVRINFYCGRKKLSQKQLYNTHGFCSNYEPKEQIEKPLTNEEWFCQLSTKEKAKWLSKQRKFIYDCVRKGRIPKIMYEEDLEYWLKEKHNESV